MANEYIDKTLALAGLHERMLKNAIDKDLEKNMSFAPNQSKASSGYKKGTSNPGGKYPGRFEARGGFREAADRKYYSPEVLANYPDVDNRNKSSNRYDPSMNWGTGPKHLKHLKRPYKTRAEKNERSIFNQVRATPHVDQRLIPYADLEGPMTKAAKDGYIDKGELYNLLNRKPKDYRNQPKKTVFGKPVDPNKEYYYDAMGRAIPKGMYKEYPSEQPSVDVIASPEKQAPQIKPNKKVTSSSAQQSRSVPTNELGFPEAGDIPQGQNPYAQPKKRVASPSIQQSKSVPSNELDFPEARDLPQGQDPYAQYGQEEPTAEELGYSMPDYEPENFQEERALSSAEAKQPPSRYQDIPENYPEWDEEELEWMEDHPEREAVANSVDSYFDNKKAIKNEITNELLTENDKSLPKFEKKMRIKEAVKEADPKEVTMGIAQVLDERLGMSEKKGKGLLKTFLNWLARQRG